MKSSNNLGLEMLNQNKFVRGLNFNCKRLKKMKMYDGSIKELCEGFKKELPNGGWMIRLCSTCDFYNNPKECEGYKFNG